AGVPTPIPAFPHQGGRSSIYRVLALIPKLAEIPMALLREGIQIHESLCDTPPAFNIGPSEFTSDLAAGFGRQGLKRPEISAVADEPDRAVEQLEVAPAGMVRPEMEVVIAVGQSRAEPEFRCHQVVAVPFAVNVSEAADVEPPIEVVGNPPFAH